MTSWASRRMASTLAPSPRRAGAAHRVLGETGPQLVQVARREALAAERGAPLARQLLHEAVALEREAAGALDQLGQPRGHGHHSFTSRRTESSRFASHRPVETHWNTRSVLSLPEPPRR